MEFVNEANRIVIVEGKQEIGEITWAKEDGAMVINHTGVDTAHQGKGLAAQLVDRAVDLARSEGIKIVPICPYVKAKFEKDEKYQDVWKR
ncbi:GNAT family N-acetyltransferase [Enterococcus bulliens]